MTGHLRLDLTRLFSSVVGTNGLDTADSDPAGVRSLRSRRSAGEVGGGGLIPIRSRCLCCGMFSDQFRSGA